MSDGFSDYGTCDEDDGGSDIGSGDGKSMCNGNVATYIPNRQ